MTTPNFKHLRYFWMVAKTGSVSRAAEQLHLTRTPSVPSWRIQRGAWVELFRRAGRNLELTDAGRSIPTHAEEISPSATTCWLYLHHQKAPQEPGATSGIRRFGVEVGRLLARRTGPSESRESVKLVCRKGVSALLAELAIHRLDIIIADRPMPTNPQRTRLQPPAGRERSHGFRQPCAGKKTCPGAFRLHWTVRRSVAWRRRHETVAVVRDRALHPRIVGEFDDSALMKSFGQAGVGFFVAPTAIFDDVYEQYKVAAIGRIPSIAEQLYAITTERRLTHPAIVAISKAMKQDVFGKPDHEHRAQIRRRAAD